LRRSEPKIWAAHLSDRLLCAWSLWAQVGLLTSDLQVCHTLYIVGRPEDGPRFAGVTILRSPRSVEGNESEVAASLVARVGEGDGAAEAELIGYYGRGLLYFLRRKTGDGPLADDLYQDTFRIVLERLRSKGLVNPTKLSSFIYAIAKNLVVADVRKKARRKTDSNTEAIELSPDQQGVCQLDEVLRDELATIVRQVIDELKKQRDRELLVRFYLEEQEKHAICRDLGLTEEHFNRVMFRARGRFKELLIRRERRDKLRVI